MEELNQEQLSIKAIITFLNHTEVINDDELTPATRSAMGSMMSTGSQLLEHYRINPNSNKR